MKKRWIVVGSALTFMMAVILFAERHAHYGTQTPRIFSVQAPRIVSKSPGDIPDSTLASLAYEACKERLVDPPTPLYHQISYGVSSNEVFQCARLFQQEDWLTDANLQAFLQPLPFLVPVSGQVQSPFGKRWRGGGYHEGIDIGVPQGTVIHAAGSGVVSEIKNHATYGLYIDVRHSRRVMTRYAHLSSTTVKVGQTVTPGQRIGRSGATGRVTGPHLHFEIRLDGYPADPQKFLSLGQYLDRIQLALR